MTTVPTPPFPHSLLLSSQHACVCGTVLREAEQATSHDGTRIIPVMANELELLTRLLG